MQKPSQIEQELADVKAGIPARDSEIETLRKENAELREQLEAIGAGGVNGKLMPGAVSAEPVGKVIGHELSMSGPVPIISWHHTPMSGAKECPIPVGAEIYLPPVAAQAQPEAEERPCHESDGCPTELAVLQRFWREHQQPVSGADGLPKLTDSMFDAAAGYVDAHGICIEPEQLEGILSAALAQQDADKVDAERYRAWRDAAVTNSTPFARAMRDTLPPEAREGKPRWPTAAEWDAAIDAARKEPGQ